MSEKIMHRKQADAMAELELLYETALSLIRFEDLASTLQSAVDSIAKALDADRVVLYVVDMEREIVTHAVKGGPESTPLAPVDFDELNAGLSGWALAHQETVYSPKSMMPDPRESPEVQKKRVEFGAGSIIITPLIYQDDYYGFLSIINRLDQPDFTEEDVAVAEKMSDQAAVAIYNARLLEQLHHRAASLETVAEISRAASSILSIDELLPRAVELIRESFDLYYAGIFLVDAERQWAKLRAGTGEAGQTMLDQGHKLKIGGDSMIGSSVADATPRIALDVGKEAQRFENPVLPKTRSEMALPLVSRGDVIGAMTIQSERINAFSKKDIEILQTLADQIATAIQNAELFDQSQSALSETETLYLTSRAVGEAQSIADILKGILFTVEFVELSGVSIQLISQWEEQRPVKMNVHSVTFQPDGDVAYVMHSDVLPRGIDPLLEDPEGFIIFSDVEDDQADIPDRERASMRKRSHRSAFTTGLLARGRLIGFFSFSSVRLLTETEVSDRSVRMFSRALADQVAVSMENILLVEESQRRAEQLEELSAVESALSEANTEEEILVAVVNAIDAGPEMRARLSYLDEDPEEGVVGEAVAIWENGAIQPQDLVLDSPVRHEGLPLFEMWKKASTQVQFIPDINKVEIEEEALKTLKERYHIQALVSILLRSAGQLIGVVSLAWPEPREFDEHETFILRRLVRPTAALVARRRAYLAAERARFENERRATQLATVAEVSQAVSSLLDLDELLSQTVDLIKNRFDLYYTGVFLVDESERWVVLRAGTGEAGRKMLEQGHKFDVGGESMIGQCVAQGAPQIPKAVEEAVRFVNPLLPETRAEIALPLKSRGEVLGAMTIQSSKVARFSEVDLTILETMADQLATAIINARLFAASQARLEELQRIQQRQAVESWMDYAEREQALGFRYDLNQVTPLAPSEAASFSAPPEVWDGQLVARDSKEGGDGAALLTPIDMRGETVGVLSFEEPSARSWSDDDMAILESVREQISLALENRVLYDQSQRALTETQRRAEEMQFLQEVAAFLNSVDDVVASQRELREQLSAFIPVAALQLIGYNARERSVYVMGENGSLFEKDWIDQQAGALSVAEEGQPWIADDLLRQQRFPEDEMLMAEGFRSRAILPLKLGFRTLGTLNLYSEEPGAFSAEEMMTILRQTSAQIASAIERSNLLRQTRNALSEAEVLSQASSALSKATSYEAVLSAILEHTILQEAVRAEIGLFVQDPATGAEHDWIEVVASRSNHPALSAWIVGQRLPVAEAPGLRLAGSEPIYVCPDIEAARDLPAEVRDYYREQHIRAIVVTPLLVSGERLGLFRMGFLEPYDPNEQELRIYRTIAGQAAVVLSNRQLLQVSQDRAERLESAVEMASLTTGIMEREDLLLNAVDFFKDRFNLYYAGIFLLDDEGQWAVLEAGTGEAGKKLQQMGFRLLVDGDSTLARCVRTMENQLTLDVSAEDERFDNPLLPDTQSEVALPLISRGQVIGAMSIQSDQRFAFTEDDVATLQLMVNQLANVIESTNLYERSQNSLEETSTLYHIAQRVADARTVEDVLQAAVDGISQREEPDVVTAALLVPPDHPTELRTEVAWARSGEDVPLIVYPIEKIRRLYDTLRIEQRFVTSDATQDPTVGLFARNIYRQMGWRAMAAFQYEIRGAQYGTIIIHNRKAREFSNAELRFYENVTRQAFVALESLNLVETTQAEAEQRAVLNEVLQVASSSLEVQTLFQEVSEVIARRQEMPVMIWHWNGAEIRPAAVYDAGGKLLLGGENAPTFTPDEAPLINHIIEHPEMTHIDFTRRLDARLPKVANFEKPIEEAVFVPLQTREGLVGVLVFGRQAGHDPIDEMELDFIRTAGINISVSLETAQLYEQAQITAEKLKEVDQLKSEFLANMSHELRTPLNSIIGFSRVILKGIDGPLTDMQKTDLTAIYDSGQHLLSLINDILDISKIEAGKMEFNFEDVDLHKTVKSVMSSASALVKSKPDIDLRSNLPEDLPQVIADERRVRQVILNLLSNAAKFTEEGYIEVAATYDNYQVILSVEDTGIGIPPEKIADVFERFKQVDSSSTRRYEGTGLGMSLSRMFVQAHGGDIWVESTVGKGSTFYFSLPIGGPEAVPEEEAETPGRMTEEQAPQRTVLVVDDDETVITLFRRYLEKRGYRVFGLNSSERVVEEAKRLHPYAITLDILMPKKDGWTLIGELKDDPETRDIPLIVCSIVSDTDKGLSMGVADYLMKPIMEQELVNTLDRLEAGLEDGQHVLVVDDQPADRKLLSRVLSEAGYEVREAQGGAEAIAEIHTRPPSAVVLDLMMPEVDGFAVLEHLKANKATRDIPVVVVTAKELTAEEHERLQQGVEFLMQKGIFDQEQLLRDIETALNRFSETKHRASMAAAATEQDS